MGISSASFLRQPIIFLFFAQPQRQLTSLGTQVHTVPSPLIIRSCETQIILYLILLTGNIQPKWGWETDKKKYTEPNPAYIDYIETMMVEFIGSSRKIVNFQRQLLKSWDWNMNSSLEIQQLSTSPCTKNTQTRRSLEDLNTTSPTYIAQISSNKPV
jgi:hypothetical protein